tara:strand:- start:129 stop:560 length:432 start_codon:yes stop_codon:yes gene_type:complete
MILIKELSHNDADLCFQLDSSTISLWNKKQWENEFNKKGGNILGILFSEKIIGICSFSIVLDEAQINYFSVSTKFRRKGYGTLLMKHLIKKCELFNLKKLLLEVSEENKIAIEFYDKFDFLTVGFRKKFYIDGSNALLKEKYL